MGIFNLFGGVINNEIKENIRNKTGIIVHNGIGAVITYYDADNYFHCVLIENSDNLNEVLINQLAKYQENTIRLDSNISSVSYPVQKYYVRIHKKIKEKGYIDLEYEIMLARSYDSELGAKNRKYLSVLLATGAGVYSGGIHGQRCEHVYTYPECDSPHLIGSVGDVIKNATFGIKLLDPDDKIVIEDYTPQNMNPNIKTETKSKVTYDFKNVSKFAIPCPSASLTVEHNFSYDSAMYQINAVSKGNVLERDFIWELQGESQKWSYKNSKCWSGDLLFGENYPDYNIPTYGYYDPEKLKLEGYLYDFKPQLLIRYSADVEYEGISMLQLDTSVTVGAMLSSVTLEFWENPFRQTVRAVNNKPSFEFSEYEVNGVKHKINTLTTVTDTQVLKIDWNAPVFQQYYPTVYKFIHDNLCLTINDDEVIASEPLSLTDKNYHTQKWLFDSENKLIRSFNNPNLCIAFKDKFILTEVDTNKSENVWFAKKADEQNHTLYYKDQFIIIKDGKLALADQKMDVLVKLDSY